MAFEFLLPELGANVPGGDVLRVLVQPGDVVARDQPVVELETDKVTVSLPAPATGVIPEQRAKVGATLKVGAIT